MTASVVIRMPVSARKVLQSDSCLLCFSLNVSSVYTVARESVTVTMDCCLHFSCTSRLKLFDYFQFLPHYFALN